MCIKDKDYMMKTVGYLLSSPDEDTHTHIVEPVIEESDGTYKRLSGAPYIYTATELTEHDTEILYMLPHHHSMHTTDRMIVAGATLVANLTACDVLHDLDIEIFDDGRGYQITDDSIPSLYHNDILKKQLSLVFYDAVKQDNMELVTHARDALIGLRCLTDTEAMVIESIYDACQAQHRDKTMELSH